MMKPAFFYGLFMDGDLLIEKGFNPVNPIPAKVDGYGLRIGARATLQKSAEECSYGTIIQLTEEELNLLYSDESVADYLPVAVTASDFNGNQHSTISYILPIEKLSGQNSAYAKSLASVARKIGLPEEYIREIRTWIN